MTDPLPDFDALWDYDQPAETEARFRDLLPRAERSGDTAYLLQLLTQIARAQGLQRHFEAAHRTLDEVQNRLSRHTRTEVRYLLERGRVYNSAGRPDDARPLFLSAWERAREAGVDADAVDAAHMLAIVEPPDLSLEWSRRALDLAESSPDPRARRWLGSLYNNLGWTYHDAGQVEPALDTFRRGLAEREANGSPGEIHVARWCVARALRSLARYDEALAILRDLDGSEDGFVDEEIAECLLAQGHPEAAQPHFARAYERLSTGPYFGAEAPERLARLRDLGKPARLSPTVPDAAYAALSDVQKLDLYLPPGNGPHPLIVYVHGGGWHWGDKDSPALPFEPLIAAGYAVASVGYRLTDEAIFPAQICDAKAAVRWLRAHAGQYRLDPDRFGAWGDSAGGHLVALLGTSGGVEAFDDPALGHRGVSSRVQAVVDWYGPTDVALMDEQLAFCGPEAQTHNDPESPEAMLLGAPVQDVPDRVAAANPIAYISADAPPFLIQHGTGDCVVPPQQTRMLYDALLPVLGAERVTLDLVEGADHADPVFPAADNLARVIAWLDGWLKPRP